MRSHSPNSRSKERESDASSIRDDKPATPPQEDEEGQIPEEETAQQKEQDKEDDPFLVKWDDGEQGNPKNWSTAYKSWITFQLGMLALSASLGSSIISPAEPTIAAQFGVSSEAAVLCLSLMVLGFAFGPLCWAPVGEVWGRRVSLIPAMYCLSLFSIGVATSQNAQTIFICRFFSGVFGSAPVSNVSAALGDIWSPRVRGTAVSLYALAVVGGPCIGPVIGSALTVNRHLGWRWIGYILAIWVFTITTLLFFCFPEVYGPYLLKKKAQRLRKETGDSRYHHPHEDVKIDPKSIVTKHFTRPVRMLVTEPMVTCLAFYASFVYSILYMTLEVFPIVFSEQRGWPLVSSSLPFLGLFVGCMAALCVNLANQPRYMRIVDRNGGKPVPEARLAPMVVGGVCFVIGLFWFGWTADPSIPWPASVVAAGFIGAGFNIIFQQCINFLVDTYIIYAASAVSANTFLRSLLAAGMPLAAKPMFNRLGVGPAMSILGGVAALALPVPFLFMKYGRRLRMMSKFAPANE